MKILLDAIERSPTTDFQKILYFSGVTNLVDLELENDEVMPLFASDVYESSEQTLEKTMSFCN